MTEKITPTNINHRNMTQNVRQRQTIPGEYDWIKNNKIKSLRRPTCYCEFDQNIKKYIKPLRRQTSKCEYDRNWINSLFRWYLPVQVHHFNEFIYFLLFRSYSLVFRSSLTVNVRWCDFLVTFYCSRLLVWISFGHILTHFWSYWIGQNN